MLLVQSNHDIKANPTCATDKTHILHKCTTQWACAPWSTGGRNEMSHVPTRRPLLLLFRPAFPLVGSLPLFSRRQSSDRSATTRASRLPGSRRRLSCLGEGFGGPALWTPGCGGAGNLFHHGLVFAKRGHGAWLHWHA